MPNKKVKRTLLGVAVVILLLLAVFFSLRFRSVQTMLVNKFLDRLEKRYDGKLSVGEVLVRWPRRIELIDILILDPLNDTLFYASALRASVNRIDLDRNRVNISRVTLENPLAHLRQLPGGQMNYALFLESLSTEDTTPSRNPFSLSINQFVLRKGAFSFRKYGALSVPGKVTWDNFSVTAIESQISRFNFDSTGIRANIGVLSGAEQSGFFLTSFTAEVELDTAGLHTRQLELLTGKSRIISASANVTNLHPAPGDTSGLNFDVVLGMDTYLGPADLNILGGITNDITDPIEISGLFAGKLTSAVLSNARLNWSNLLYFEGDLSYDYPGLLKEAYFDLRTRNLMLNVTQLTEKVFSGQVPGFELTVPDQVKNIGSIEYSGLFTGTLENFITTGQWALPYGTFTTNLTVNKNRPAKGYNFRGQISAGEFNPDEWIAQARGISGMDFLLDVDGVWDGVKTVNALVNGTVRQFTLNSYTFQNLDIRGEARGRIFEGSLVLRDPNINMDLSGHFDLSTSLPALDFDLKLAKTNLNALNIIRNDTAACVDLTLHGDIAGNNLHDFTGTVKLLNTVYSNSHGKLAIDELMITAGPEAGRRQVVLSSDYVDARLVGTLHFEDLADQIQSLVARYVPALTNVKPVEPEHLNDFAFNIQLKNPTPVTRILLPGLQFKDNTRIDGSYDASDQVVYFEGTSPQFTLGGSQFTGFDIKLQSRGDSVILSGGIEKMQFDKNNLFEKISLDMLLTENTMDTRLHWKNQKAPSNEGSISCQGILSQAVDGRLTSHFTFPATDIVYNDSLWKVEPFTIVITPDRLALSEVTIRHRIESMGVSGAISHAPEDTLFLSFNNLNLNHVNQMNRSKNMTLSGFLTGNAKFFDLSGKGMFLSDLEIDSLGFNGQMLGKTTITSRSGGIGEPVEMSVLARRGAIKTLQIKGLYNPVTDSLDFTLDLDKLRMDIANPFVNPDLRDIKGIASGQVRLTGKRSKPQLNGNVMVQKGSFIVDYINTKFSFTHQIQVTPDAFIINQMELLDDEGNPALVTGAVRHDNFSKIRLDLALEYQNFVLLNVDENNNDGYWGRAYGSGVGTIKGPLRNLMIDISATTTPKTKFFVPVSTAGDARELDFITYVERPLEESEPDLLDFTSRINRGYEVNLHGATVNIDLAVTPDAEVRLIFDSKVGDVLRAQGSGNIRIYVNPASRWTLTGDYTIDRGDYQFTLQNMPVKKLQIEPGGTIKWTRDVSSAQLDIDAVYRTKASLYDLLQDESNTDQGQRIPVECHLMMSGLLQSPGFDFNIVIPPTSNDIARSQLANLTKEEMNKQVISLLILNRFSPLQGATTGTSRGYATAGFSTTTEVLSNQLNYMLSQISTDFDIGFNYRPGDQLTSDEVEVALSKQFLKNRMTLNVNGNYDIRQTNANASQLVGDVEVEYKINPSGKLRLKAFTRANDHLLYEYAPYTQGVGLFYREEFDSFGDLFKRYKSKLSGKGR